MMRGGVDILKQAVTALFPFGNAVVGSEVCNTSQVSSWIFDHYGGLL